MHVMGSSDLIWDLLILACCYPLKPVFLCAIFFKIGQNLPVIIIKFTMVGNGLCRPIDRDARVSREGKLQDVDGVSVFRLTFAGYNIIYNKVPDR